MAIGIPDDTPENTVRFIVKIVREEAGTMKATVETKQSRHEIANEITIDVTPGKRSCRIILKWVDSCDLSSASGTIGNGHLWEDWQLELLPKDLESAPPSRPFVWGLYQPGDDYLQQPPKHILDGVLLRRLLHEKLSDRGGPLSNGPRRHPCSCART